MINDDIDAIIQRGEQRTVELSNRYEGLSFEDLSNFKSEASVQQWEGEDFRAVCIRDVLKVARCRLTFPQRKQHNFNLLSMPKRERKTNYSVDGYFKDAMRIGPSKQEKAPKLPRAPKQVQMWVAFVWPFDSLSIDALTRNDFQFFPPKLAELQERELAAFKVDLKGTQSLSRY